MKNRIKTILRYTLGGYIGWCLVAQIFIALLLVPLAWWSEIYNYKTLSPYSTIYEVLGYVIMFFGVGFGLWSVRKRNILYQVFWPTLANIKVSVAITAILGVCLFVFSHETRSWWLWASSQEIVKALWGVSVGFMQGVLHLFPFAALVNYVYCRWREGLREGLLPWIILAVIINPYFSTIGIHVDNAIDFHTKYDACGAQVDIYPDKPAEKAGMQNGEVINELDGIKTVTPEILLSYTGKKQNNDPWRIVTDRREYSIVPTFDEVSQKYKIGVYLRQAYCNSKGEFYKYKK
ncbi:MAG: hypothetical protein AB7S78_13550 [Candidatus Omnitrophota bacterium]